MAATIRAFDWAATPLGPIETWPASLRHIVDFLLASPELASVAVGPQRILIYNDVAAAHYGTRHPRALGRALAETFEEYPSVADFYDRAFAGEGVQVPAQPLDPSGEHRGEVYEAFLTPIHDEAGMVVAVHMSGIARGGQARAEAALRESEARYRSIFASMADGVYLAEAIFDAEGRCVDLRYHDENAAAVRMTGQSAKGRLLSELGAYEPYWYAIFGDTAKTGTPHDAELFAAPDGIWYAFRTFKPPGARENELVVVFSDVTVQHKLAESEAMRRVALSGGRMGSWRWDRAADLIRGDAQFMALWGLPPTDDALPLATFAARMTSAGAAEMAEIVAGPTAGRWVQWQGRAAADDPAVLHGVTYDITERTRAEAALRESEERQAFLLNLSDAVRPLADPADVEGETTRLLRERLDAGWCYYVDWDLDEQVGLVRRDSASEGLPSLAGAHDVSDAPEFLQLLTAGAALTVRDYADYEQLPARIRRTFTALGFRSMMAAPLVKRGRLLATLIVGDTQVRDWTASETSLLIEAAERTWAAVERSRAEVALRGSEEKYRTLFEAVDEGFAILQMVRDDAGRLADLIYREVNPAFARLTGLDARPGLRVREIVPKIEEGWLAYYDRVSATGRPEVREDYNGDTGRWFRTNASRIGGADSPLIAVTFDDVTDRKLAELVLREGEERQAFLLKLSDALRAETDAGAIAVRAVQMLADALQLDRCYVVAARPGDTLWDVGAEFRLPGLPAMPPVLDTRDFPETWQVITGRTFVMDDPATQPDLTDAERSMFQALGFGGLLMAVLRKGEGKPAWAIVASFAQPHRWTPSEIALVEDMAERTWAAIERARAETALRESEERQGFLLRLSDALRPLSDVETIQHEAMRLLGEHLGVHRAQYFIADETGEYLSSMGGYTDGVDAAVGRFRLTEFGQYAYDGFHVGETQVVADAPHDPRIGENELRSYRTVGFLAYIGVPFVQRGRLLGIVAVHQAEPRHWTEAERRLVEETAERAGIAIEQARAEAALRESASKHRDLFEKMEEGYLIGEVIFEDGRAVDMEYVEANPAAIRMIGVDVVGRRMRDIDPNYEEYWYELYGRVASSGITERDTRYAAPVDRWYDYRMAKLDPGDPDSRRVTVLFADASARVAAEHSLRDIEERQRLMIELVPVLLWSASPAGREVSVNEGWAAYTGQNEAETQDYGWLDAIHPDDLPGTQAAFEHAFATGEPLERQQRIKKVGDGYRWHLVRHVPVRDENGAITRWFGAAVDIHDSKLAEQALQDTERRLQTLIEGVPQLVWRAVDDGHWTWASPQWTDYTGQAEPDSHDWGWLDPVHPDDRERVEDVWAGAMERGEFHADYRLCHAEEGRYRWFQTRATPVRDDDGDIIEWLGTSTDVDDLRELQDRQQVLVAELQHRTRNLIGVVRSTADRTGDSSRDFADFRDRFRDRLDALARVQGLLSRLNDNDRVAFDKLIRTELAAMSDDDRRVSLDGPTGIRLRSSMVQTLAMALHELATNAVKYGALNQPDGRLAISWRLVEPDRQGRPRLRIDWVESGVHMPPPGAGPQGGGQGRELIEQALPYQLNATTRFELGADGVRCTINIPVSVSTRMEATNG